MAPRLMPDLYRKKLKYSSRASLSSADIPSSRSTVASGGLSVSVKGNGRVKLAAFKRSLGDTSNTPLRRRMRRSVGNFLPVSSWDMYDVDKSAISASRETVKFCPVLREERSFPKSVVLGFGGRM